MGAFKGIYSSIETAHCLNVNRLVSTVKKAVKDAAPQLTPSEVDNAVYSNLIRYQRDGQTFSFTPIPNKLGGNRWMALCPSCQSRVLKLFKPDSADKFLCKDCHHLRPPSALYGPTRRYKEVIRPLRRMERIKEILSTSSGLSEAKTKSLLDEYDTLNTSVQTSTFYRKALILSNKS